MRRKILLGASPAVTEQKDEQAGVGKEGRDERGPTLPGLREGGRRAAGGPLRVAFSLPSCWHQRLTHFSPFPSRFCSSSCAGAGGRQRTGAAASDLCLPPSVFPSHPAPGTGKVTQVLPWSWACCHKALFISDTRITQPCHPLTSFLYFYAFSVPKEEVLNSRFSQPGSSTRVLQPSLRQAGPAVLPAAGGVKLSDREEFHSPSLPGDFHQEGFGQGRGGFTCRRQTCPDRALTSEETLHWPSGYLFSLRG